MSGFPWRPSDAHGTFLNHLLRERSRLFHRRLVNSVVLAGTINIEFAEQGLTA